MADFFTKPSFNVWDVIGGGLNLYGAYKSAEAKEDAADFQREINREGIAAETQARLPYSSLGTAAAQTLEDRITDNHLLKPFSAADFEASPGYNFRLNEGLRAQRSKENAVGGLYSTAALRAAQRYGQNLASDEYSRAHARYTGDKINNYNILRGAIGAGSGTLPNQQGYYSGIADAGAAGIVGSTSDIYGGIADAYNALDERQFANTVPRIYLQQDGTVGYK